jgi:hypothetical protein
VKKTTIIRCKFCEKCGVRKEVSLMEVDGNMYFCSDCYDQQIGEAQLMSIIKSKRGQE